MPSCTNSSNIQSSLVTQVIREEANGKRVAFNISSGDAGISSGVTLGSVIRYDVPSDMYVPSRADDPATAEVIGIVESVQTISGSPVYTVVASGLVKYPDINSVINRYASGCTTDDGGTGGDDGGPDIFFLSDYCYGKLQLLEPTTSGHIVKPVMQRVAVGEYNGIVLNYIGYEVADAATSDLTNIMPASAVYYAQKDLVMEGFIDASTAQVLNAQQYSELYDVFGISYGTYEETITLVNPGINLNSLIDSEATQKTAYNTNYNVGEIVLSNQTNNSITIRKESTQPKTDLTKKIVVSTLKLTPSNSSITAFTVPAVPKQTVSYTASSGSRDVELTPYMRVKKDVTSVFVPDIVELSKLVCDNITTNGITVGTKLSNLESRLQAVERRLGI